MTKVKTHTATVTSMLALLAGVFLSSTALAAGSKAMEEGKKVAFDRKKGNCLACHVIAGGELAGTIGPPLIAMKARFPDRAKLRAQIYDATTRNPNTIMPPFGKHKAMTDEEVDLVTDFIHSL